MSKNGYRGYITSRAVNGSIIPQRVQNLVVRDYAQKNDLGFKLSAVEHIMEGSAMILEGVLDELPSLDGIVVYSLFILPDEKTRRLNVYRRILDGGCVLHAALEGFAIREDADIARFEDIIDVRAIVPHCRAEGY